MSDSISSNAVTHLFDEAFGTSRKRFTSSISIRHCQIVLFESVDLLNLNFFDDFHLYPPNLWPL